MTNSTVTSPAQGSTAGSLVRTPPGVGSLGGIGLVLAGTVSVQFGSALAALLFPRVGALGVVSLRATLAALLLLLVCRPRLRGHSRTDWAVAGAFGVALGGMNILFYQAIDRIPLGPAVTLEVLGPLLLSVVAARRVLSLLWAAWPWRGSSCWAGADSPDSTSRGPASRSGRGPCGRRTSSSTPGREPAFHGWTAWPSPWPSLR